MRKRTRAELQRIYGHIGAMKQAVDKIEERLERLENPESHDGCQ